MPMLEGNLFSGIVNFTVPIILTSLLQLLFNAADLVVVGHFCRSMSVSAVGSTAPLTNHMVTAFSACPHVPAGRVATHTDAGGKRWRRWCL